MLDQRALYEVPTGRHAVVRFGLWRPDPAAMPNSSGPGLGSVHKIRPISTWLFMAPSMNGSGRFSILPRMRCHPAQRRRTVGTARVSWCRPTERFVGGAAPDTVRWPLNFGIFGTSGFKSLDADTYRCPWNNGIFEPSQINWAIPNFSLSGHHGPSESIRRDFLSTEISPLSFRYSAG